MTLESASSVNKNWPGPHLQLMHKPPPEMLAVKLHCRHLFVALKKICAFHYEKNKDEKSRFRDVPLTGPLQVDDLVVAVHRLLEWNLPFFLTFIGHHHLNYDAL